MSSNSYAKLLVSLAVISMLLSGSYVYGTGRLLSDIAASTYVIYDDTTNLVTKEDYHTLPILKVVSISEDIDYLSLDMTTHCGYTVDQLESVLSHNLQGHADTYLLAESLYDVNALYLYAIDALESDYGRSYLATYQNNVSGLRVGTEWSSFSSVEECILTKAKLLSNNYLNEDGSYYNGKTVMDVNINYCVNSDGSPNYNWSYQIASLCEELSNKINTDNIILLDRDQDDEDKKVK